MNAKSLLTATAALELPTGVALLAAPSFVAKLLLGEALDPGTPIVLGRVAGAALVAIGLSCFAERGTAGHSGLPIGLLTYNAAVAVLLAHAALIGHMRGPVLWPAVVAHALLARWCARRVLRQASALSSH